MFTIATIAAILLGIFLLLRQYSEGFETCSTVQDGGVAGPGKFDIQIEETLCDGLASSDVENIYLADKNSDRRSLVFAFGRMNADPRFSREDVPPTVKWLSANEIVIDIDAINYSSVRRISVDGVAVHYRIGKIIAP